MYTQTTTTNTTNRTPVMGINRDTIIKVLTKATGDEHRVRVTHKMGAWRLETCFNPIGDFKDPTVLGIKGSSPSSVIEQINDLKGFAAWRSYNNS